MIWIDPHDGLRSALESREICRVIASGCSAWASATFAGSRHEFTVEVRGAEQARHFAEGLSECDFVLPGHIVADISLIGSRTENGRSLLSIEALTVEAG